MKRSTVRTVAVLLATVLLFSVRAEAISAEKAILLDATTGRILYEKDADTKSLIASTTKIMTALVVCEQSNVLDRMRIPKEAVGIEGSSMYLREGEVLAIQELLYGLMLSSGNDAAVALAIHCGGTVEGFVQMMNDKAAVLGLSGTHFENPNGLDAPAHYSTARDLARLTAYAMNDPIFYKTVSAKTVKVGERYLRNHNKLLWMIDGADGVKTGYTKAAGRILVSSATRENRRLIAVTINAPDDWNDHQALMRDGFSRYEVKTLVTQGDVLGTREIIGGAGGSVTLHAAKDLSYAVAKDEQVTFVASGGEFAYAPVVSGADAGYVYLCIDGNAVEKIPVVYGQTVEMEKIEKKNFFQKLFGE